MISTQISRASAGVLLAGGLVLLFAADVVLAHLIPGFPASGAWIGQLLAAAWLGLAALDWTSQRSLLGGIYGRPIVLANAAHYFIASMVLLRQASRGGTPPALWLVIVPLAVLTLAYGWLLMRGPFARDIDAQRAAV